MIFSYFFNCDTKPGFGSMYGLFDFTK